MEAAHLVLVDTSTGEQHNVSECPRCAELQDILHGAEKDLNAWRTRYANLKRDKEAEARDDPLWPNAVKLFKLWKSLTGSTRSKFRAERFEQVEPFLRDHGPEMCVRAIVGACFDPFVTTRKNGSKKKHWGWELIFRTAEKTEEMANRAPSDWRERAAEAGWEWPE
jgi:hypothetical protein